MQTKQTIEILLKLLSEETKKIKKKKKAPVAAPILKRPMGSMFYMDAAVSLNESAIKPITKKFDHLKWKLNDVQKQFLDDFINIPDEGLREDDYKYASRTTGIPLESIKSIKNTYGDKKTPEQIAAENKHNAKELGLGGGMLDQETLDIANEKFTEIRDLPKIGSGKQWSMNPNPGFRGKTPVETIYNAGNNHVDRATGRTIPNFMYEWLMYFMEGSGTVEIRDSKLMNELHASTSEGGHKYVMFLFDNPEKISGAHPYDVLSSKSNSFLREFMEKVGEFNETFNTNFKITNQYVNDDNKLAVIFENMQFESSGEVKDSEMFDFSVTDRERAQMYGLFGIDDMNMDDLSSWRNITG